MRIDLKSEQYYDFYRIKYVKVIDNDFVEIVGNFAKGKKSKKVNITVSMIDNNSWKQFKRYAKKYMKEFLYDGLCPYCDSDNIWEIQQVVRREKINDPKKKKKESEVKTFELVCEACNKYFDKERVKYCDITIYY